MKEEGCSLLGEGSLVLRIGGGGGEGGEGAGTMYNIHNILDCEILPVNSYCKFSIINQDRIWSLQLKKSVSWIFPWGREYHTTHA